MYAVIECINGSYSVKAENLDEQAAKVFYFDRCKILWSASDVLLGQVAIVNQQLQVVGGYSEQIIHTVESDPEEVTE
jgi:hypothetical protein